MIREADDAIKNQTAVECRTATCASQSESGGVGFQSEVVAGDNREAGSKCEVEIFTRTGFSESEHTIISHYEGTLLFIPGL